MVGNKSLRVFVMEDDKQIDMMVDMILYGISKNGGV